jgi:thiamine kinase-like enzyme
MTTALDTLPSERRELAQAALQTAFGSNTPAAFEPLGGGASGASLYRFETSGGRYVLRLEGPRTVLRNPHQYTCMQTAAEAGVAPRLLYLDAERGVAIMDFVQAETLSKYPGGPRELAAELGRLVARLQQTVSFPELHDYPAIIARMIERLDRAELFAEGLLAPHRELFERIREVYPWRRSGLVSSHNDPNPQNVIFDGRRLWLIDWETAFCNEPLTDVAILADNFARSPELESALLEGWLGHRGLDVDLRAQLLLMRLLTRLYYAGLLLWIGRMRAPRRDPESDLSAPTPTEFGATVAQGRLKPGSPEALCSLGKMLLASFLDGARVPGFEDALSALR